MVLFVMISKLSKFHSLQIKIEKKTFASECVIRTTEILWMEIHLWFHIVSNTRIISKCFCYILAGHALLERTCIARKHWKNLLLSKCFDFLDIIIVITIWINMISGSLLHCCHQEVNLNCNKGPGSAWVSLVQILPFYHERKRRK